MKNIDFIKELNNRGIYIRGVGSKAQIRELIRKYGVDKVREAAYKMEKKYDIHS